MQEKTQEQASWCVICTSHCREQRVADYLTRCGLSSFIPMKWAEKYNPKNEKIERVLEPAIHNLLFIKKIYAEQELYAIREKSPTPFNILHNPLTGKIQEIPEKRMVEFRAICDPSYTGTLYVEAEIAETRIGTPVRVIRGTFTGLEGKLTRYKGRHYVIVTLATMGVMIHIPKWYCQPTQK